MHMRIPPSFLGAKRIGAPNGEIEGWMYPFSVSSLSCFFNSSNPYGDILRGALWGGSAPRIKSIL